MWGYRNLILRKSLNALIGRLFNILQGTLLPVVLWTMQGWSPIQTTNPWFLTLSVLMSSSHNDVSDFKHVQPHSQNHCAPALRVRRRICDPRSGEHLRHSFRDL